MTTLETGLHYPLELDKLPEGWEAAYVGDFAIDIEPGFASGEHNREGTGVPHLRPMNIDRSGKIDLNVVKYVDPAKNVRRLRCGDVLFNNTNSPELVGKTTAITKQMDWAFSNHMTRIAFSERVDHKFAAYQLHFLWMTGYFLHKCVKHVNQASVSSTTLARTVPFIRPPLDQQKVIVAEIEKQFSRLDEAIANLKRVRANLKRYKAAVLKAAVEGKLTEEWRKAHPDVEPASELLKRILAVRRAKWHGKGKYKEPARRDTTDLPPLPDGWTWATLPQLGELNRGKSKHRPRNDPKLYSGNYPFIQTGDIRQAVGVITRHTQTYSEEGLKQSRLWPKGTLCITIAANIADTAILGFDACFPDSVVGFIPATCHTDVRFLEYFLRTTKENIERFAPATAQKNINLEILRDVGVPFPPEEEQGAIITEVESRLSMAENVEITTELSTVRIQRLRQSILTRAFSGQLVSVAEGKVTPDAVVVAS